MRKPVCVFRDSRSQAEPKICMLDCLNHQVFRITTEQETEQEIHDLREKGRSSGMTYDRDRCEETTTR